MRSARNAKIVLSLLLLSAATEFLVRGPIRYLNPTDWSDLAQNYAATRLWLRGQNFADPENFVALWRDEVHATLDSKTGRTHLAPPPGTLVLMAPIGAMSWPAAKIAWLIVLLASFAATVWALIKTAGFRLGEPRTLAFIAGCLALAPFHTGIAAQNQTVLVVGLCALGIWAASGSRDLAAGLLFGAACSLKPHIGSFIVLYYLVRGRWRLFVTALAFTAVLVLIAIGWLQISGTSWRVDYFHNIKVLTVQNRIDDFTSDNPIRFLLINLQVPFYSITHRATSANLLALAVVALLLCVWLSLLIRKKGPEPELLALSSIAVIGLLPVYHRFYDASLLAIPLCWSVSRLAGDLKKVATAALLLTAPFLVPGTAILQQCVRQGRVPRAWADSWWWNCLVMPHESWFLLGLGLALLYGLAVKPPALKR